MEKIKITDKMIREHLGVNDGYRVKIKRNSKVYRQKNKGDRWEYCGTSAQVAWDYAKEHKIKEWELGGPLYFDDLFNTIDTFHKHGLSNSKDMNNFMRMILNRPFDDIYKNGVIWIVGSRPKEAEEAFFFDHVHQDSIREEMAA